MMMIDGVISEKMQKTVESAVSDLVRLERIKGACYVNMPLLYPDGSYVTLRIDQIQSGLRVSDAGFTFRQVDDVGASRSFKKTANRIAEMKDICVGTKAIYVDIPPDDLERAMLDVAEVSWRVADRICERVFDEDEEGMAEDLSERLVKLFGADYVEIDKAIMRGASTIEWPMTSIVSFADHKAVFQTVTSNANSVNRASTAFRDISDLPNPPRLVAVVRSKKDLGSRSRLLAPGRIIEEAQSDALFRRAAA